MTNIMNITNSVNRTHPIHMVTRQVPYWILKLNFYSIKCIKYKIILA